MINKPELSSLPYYYQYYVNLITENDLFEAFENNKKEFIQFISSIEKDKLDFSYEMNKWTVREVIRHILDTERIFQYRAFRFSRFDFTPLSGFDENKYISKTTHLILNKEELIEEFSLIRQNTIALYRQMNNDMLDFLGEANKQQSNARGLGFFIVGHQKHHTKIIKERYFLN
ncbi:MAG: DinB family protein [Flavobacteriia bacterium]|nr:DinB family protein [Flavobacteriia bacterium]